MRRGSAEYQAESQKDAESFPHIPFIGQNGLRADEDAVKLQTEHAGNVWAADRKQRSAAQTNMPTEWINELNGASDHSVLEKLAPRKIPVRCSVLGLCAACNRNT